MVSKAKGKIENGARECWEDMGLRVREAILNRVAREDLTRGQLSRDQKEGERTGHTAILLFEGRMYSVGLVD